MALKPVVKAEEHANLPADVKKEYEKQDDGTFLLSVVNENGYELSNVTPLRNTLGRQKDQLADLKEERESLNTKITSLEKQIEEMRSENPDIESQVQSQVASIKEKLQSDLEKANEQLKAKDALVQKHVLEATAAAAISKEGGNVDLLMPHVLRRLKVEQEGDELKVIPIQQDGSPWISQKSGSTNTGTVDELVSGPEFKKSSVFASCFKADRPSGGTGGESQIPNKSADGSSNNNDQNLSPSQRLALLRKNKVSAEGDTPD